MQAPPAAPQILKRGDGSTIAYHSTTGKSSNAQTGVIFLGGFQSDMGGGKAMALENWCTQQGRAYLRFDYTGHGQSSVKFEDGCIGDWAADAIYAVDQLSKGPQILVGSSMGGWMMLLTALARPERVAGLIGLAAAPDFTEDLIWKKATDEQRAEMDEHSYVTIVNDYDPQEPTIITQKLIEDGRNHLLLRDPINIKVPVRLIHGQKDLDVPWETALDIQKALVSTDVEVQIVKDSDHRLSEVADLTRLTRTLDNLLKDIEPT